jgi:hypothetical protein
MQEKRHKEEARGEQNSVDEKRRKNPIKRSDPVSYPLTNL